ncbi:class II fructose-bisphosphatase [Paenibacillus herberti]|uniref:Fructose-1,6-bisphosphatase n=1 Tax=Paenibacillus herberti TaxID=1619309 RepID=A0A229NW33_9BACL|nr:class II fructose-bisphosphatase [Paenibacillus herberti]OXM14072.1 fructose-bisphosphatase class II [Paenibacillus herberti]SDT01239.1 fructose-1,6-bisphosphatase II [Paenibacillaceae bacterium GAS479]
MERELALEVVRVTELAALASAPWVGRGSKMQADDAATEAMRRMFGSISIRGKVVIGEGEMDEAPMLYIGEKLGTGIGPEVDVAVDPLEGTELAARGLNNAISVLALAPKGQLLHAPDMYMEKLAVGPELAGRLNLLDPLSATVRKAARELDKPLSELTVLLLDRPRHAALMSELRELGVRIRLLTDGDVTGAMAPCYPETGVDLYVGSGGAPEGVLAAAAIKCLGGEIQGRLLPENDEQLRRCILMGISNPSRVLGTKDMAGNGDVIFAATGVTKGDFLEGVRYLPGRMAHTHSVVMRAATRTVRYIHTRHDLSLKAVERGEQAIG